MVRAAFIPVHDSCNSRPAAQVLDTGESISIFGAGEPVNGSRFQIKPNRFFLSYFFQFLFKPINHKNNTHKEIDENRKYSTYVSYQLWIGLISMLNNSEYLPEEETKEEKNVMQRKKSSDSNENLLERFPVQTLTKANENGKLLLCILFYFIQT